MSWKSKLQTSASQFTQAEKFRRTDDVSQSLLPNLMLDPSWDVEDFSRTFELNFSRDIFRLDQPQPTRWGRPPQGFEILGQQLLLLTQPSQTSDLLPQEQTSKIHIEGIPNKILHKLSATDLHTPFGRFVTRVASYHLHSNPTGATGWNHESHQTSGDWYPTLW